MPSGCHNSAECELGGRSDPHLRKQLRLGWQIMMMVIVMMMIQMMAMMVMMVIYIL